MSRYVYVPVNFSGQLNGCIGHVTAISPAEFSGETEMVSVTRRKFPAKFSR